MIFEIKKNRHYSQFNIDKLQPFATKRVGKVIFSKECWYHRSEVEYTGWNKLTGIAQLFGVHKNSGRLVWQPDFNNPGSIEIAGYVYSNGGKWVAKKISYAICGVEYDYSVQYNSALKWWVFKFNSHVIFMSGKKPSIMRKCFPYFGGKSKAPETMTIKL